MDNVIGVISQINVNIHLHVIVSVCKNVYN